jgi:hypothetical protein
MTTTTKSKAAFIEQTKADYAAWKELIATIPDDRKHEPGAAGHWSVKDLVAHIAVYERWTIEWLEPALQGNPPEWSPPVGEEGIDIDEQNAMFYEQYRDRSLADIEAEAATIHEWMMDLLHHIPDDSSVRDIREFAPQVGLHYRAGTTILGAIDGNAAEHYRQHIADVQAWLAETLS